MNNITKLPSLLPILIVDDDQVDVKAIKRCFSKSGLDQPVHWAKDGMEALALLRGEDGHGALSSPAVLLVDINMPRMGGIELIRAVKKDDELKASQIYVLTMAKRAEEIESTYNLDVEGYIFKENLENDLGKLAVSMKNAPKDRPSKRRISP